MPSTFVLQSENFLPYKSGNAFKGLVVISPDSLVTSVSSLAKECISDRKLVKKSGFLYLLFEDGDMVMADKSFIIEDLLEPLNLVLKILSVLQNRQFSEAEIIETEAITSLRIHMKRRLQRVKNFHLFHIHIPLATSLIINQFCTVCVILTNFQAPLVKENQFV